jgi:hypothetical protein
MSNENQNPNPISSDQISLDSPEQYLDYVIQATKQMLGILNFEYETATKNQTLSARDNVFFEAAMILLAEMQHTAVHRKEDLEKGDIIVPSNGGIVDQFGNPIKGNVQA